MAKSCSMMLAVAMFAALPAGAMADDDAGGGELLSANFSVAVMLLASVTYMMSTFCLVNHSDKDIRQAAWQVMNTTISIFSAVLMFQGLNEVVAFYFLEGVEPHVKLIVNMVHACVWYMLLQVVLAWISGAVSSEELCHHAAQDDDETEDGSEATDEEASEEASETDSVAEKKEEKTMNIKYNMKSGAVLMGHVTGFACINAFGTLQNYVVGEDAELTPHNVMLTLLGGPLAAAITLQIFYTGMAKVRQAIALGDDGKEDEFEIIWEEETEETEDDVLGLTISFTIVQVLRFIITSHLPNEEGEVEGVDITYHLWQVGALAGLGVLWFLGHVGRTLFAKNLMDKRRNEQFKVIASMVYSWCFFFAGQWLVHMTVTSWGLSDEGFATINSVVLALLLNIVGYTKIFILDKMADAEWSTAEMDESLRALMFTIGILIGFAWEKSFDAAVVTTASRFTELPNCVTKLLLSGIVCSTVIPAYRWYIIPKLFRMGFFDEEEEEDKEGESGESADEEAPSNTKKDDLKKPLLDQQKESAANVRAEIERYRQRSMAQNAQLRELKVKVDAHTEDAKNLPTQIKQVLDEVVRVRSTLEQPQ